MAWINETDLATRLGPSTYLAIFDDANVGSVNLAAVDAVIRDAHADMLRYSDRFFPDGVPEVIPDELFTLELDFAQARALMRGDAYARDTGVRLLQQARGTAKEIAETIERAGPDEQSPGPQSPDFDPTPVGAQAAMMVDFGQATGTPASMEFFRRERGW